MLLTTQYLEEADQLASRIAVIDDGRVVAEGAPGQLKASGGAGTLRLRLTDPAHRPQASRCSPRCWAPRPPMTATRRADRDARTRTRGAPAGEQAAAALTALAGAGIAIGEFTVGQPTLDDVFLALTARDREKI